MSSLILKATERTDDHHIEKHASFLKFINDKEPLDILFIGDSITRRWEDNSELFNHFFAEYRSVNFGVGGDSLENLKWRILNGELEEILPNLVVLHIGTNNLPLNSTTEIYSGIRDILKIFRDKLPKSKILLLGLLPRNMDDTKRDYMTMIKEINLKLKSTNTDIKVSFLDLGEHFLETVSSVRTDLLPDGLHPAEKGYTVLGELLKQQVHSLMNG